MGGQYLVDLGNFKSRAVNLQDMVDRVVEGLGDLVVRCFRVVDDQREAEVKKRQDECLEELRLDLTRQVIQCVSKVTL